MKNEELAIIKDVHIGVRDTDSCICWFTVELLSGASLQIISIDQLRKLINRHHIYKLEDLNNKPCIVSIDGNLVKFVDLKL